MQIRTGEEIGVLLLLLCPACIFDVWIAKFFLKKNFDR